MLAPDTLLQDRYRIVRLIGKGGMGAVYEAVDQRLGHTVALKETIFDYPRLRQAFEREARLLAGLRHPALPVVSDYFFEGTGQFLVMQFIPGDDLETLLERNGGRFATADVLRWGDQLLVALEYLHAQRPPIVHRDIKPLNLKLTPGGEIVLLDFGLAKATTAQRSRPMAESSLAGFTPHYAPLEQMQGVGSEPRSDLYALAATLYYLMTGVVPPDAVTRAMAVLGGQPDPLRPANELNPEVPPAIAAVLLRALAVNRDERPATAAAMRAQLREALAGPGHGERAELTAEPSDDAAARPKPPAAAASEHSEVATRPAQASPRTLPRPVAGRDRGSYPTNLPQQLTSFIGREREMAEVKRLLATTRLLTLTGAGGCGKTRLSLQVATDLLEEHADGVWLVELAALADPALVPQAVATALGVREEPGRLLLATLADSLRPKQLLLLLDNCEHLVAACAALVDVLLRACPTLQILATSREALGIAGETAWRVPSLALPNPRRPPSLERLMQYEAARLFIERAVAALPSFTLTNQHAPAVAQVCHRLDGIPLAIELAAARVKVLTVEQIAARLDDRFRLLTGGSRTALPRQQTLRALVDWSYDLLAEPERALLRRLAVFAGGFTLPAAEAVCPGEAVEAYDVLDLLAQLVEKSLVMAEEQGEEARYRLLETIRQYGEEKLREAGEAAALRGRHRDWYLELAERAEPELQGPAQELALGRLEREHANLREALDWCRTEAGGAEAGLRLAGALWRFWWVRGHLSEGRGWLERALARGGGAATPVRVKALNGAGNLAYVQGDYARAIVAHEESLALRRELGDKQGIAASLNNLGVVAQDQGDRARAAALHEESLALRRELGDKRGVAISLNNLGGVARDRGDYARAAALHEESLVLRRELGDKRGVAYSLSNLGVVAHDQGDYGRAMALYRESLSLLQELGDRRGIAECLEGLAEVVCARGQPERAARLFGGAAALRDAVGVPVPPAAHADYERHLAAVRARSGPEAFEAAWAQGWAMPLDQAIVDALATAAHT